LPRPFYGLPGAEALMGKRRGKAKGNGGGNPTADAGHMRRIRGAPEDLRRRLP
jgi:hypothetical protein